MKLKTIRTIFDEFYRKLKKSLFRFVQEIRKRKAIIVANY